MNEAAVPASDGGPDRVETMSSASSASKPLVPRTILVITLRRLGDVLLTTPLLRSLRCGFPDAAIDMLVFEGTEGILDGNPDINKVWTVSSGASAAETASLLCRLLRRFDLVVATQAGDRPAFLAFLAGRHRIGLISPDDGGWWKRQVYHQTVPFDPQEMRVENLLRMADMLGVPRQPKVICPQGVAGESVASSGPYAVIHATPMFRYKQWHGEGWRELAEGLIRRGLGVFVTGGPDTDERRYLDHLWGTRAAPVNRIDGQLRWGSLASLLARARVYIGPDTSVTHLAAAAGCPTVALFGPTDPRVWGPWPASGLDKPWEAAAPVQRRGNVWLVQNPFPCVPCQEEGCERHRDSPSACLDRLPVSKVLEAVDQALDRVPCLL